MAKDNLDAARKEVNSLEDQVRDLQKSIDKKRKDMEGEVAKAIVGRGVLSRIKWAYGIHYNEMVLQGKSETTELDKIWLHDYHQSIELARGVTLRSDDGELKLFFKKPELMANFVKENGLKVDLTELVSAYEQHNKQAEKELDFLNRLKKLFGKDAIAVEDTLYEANIAAILALPEKNFRMHLHNRLSQYPEFAAVIKTVADEDSVPALRLALAISIEMLRSAVSYNKNVARTKLMEQK